MALKQSHINQLRKIIAMAETLITAIERDQDIAARAPKSSSKSSTKKIAGKGRSTSKTKRAGAPSKGKAGSSKAKTKKSAGAKAKTGTRRSRAETAQFRQAILQELQSGAAIADLAAKHGVTPAYLYQIKTRAEG